MGWHVAKQACRIRGMHTILRAAMLALLVGALGTAGADSPTAQQVLASTKAQAAAQHKIIFLLFEASW